MRTSLLFVSVLALSACKTDKVDAPAATGSGSGSSAGSAVAASGSGSAAPAQPPSPNSVVTLPKSDGTPPKKKDKPLDQADVDRLGELSFEGFDKADRTGGKAFEVRLTTKRPRLAVTVTIAPCFDCTPMDLEKWKAKEPALKQLLAEELRDLPDTEWEVGKTDIGGAPAIYTYQFGYSSGKDENGPSGAFSNAYAVYFNDNVNQIRVVAEYKDDWVAREDMKRIAPREDLVKLANAFIAKYSHEW